jgi:hypothetical protein
MLHHLFFAGGDGLGAFAERANQRAVLRLKGEVAAARGTAILVDLRCRGQEMMVVAER